MDHVKYFFGLLILLVTCCLGANEVQVDISPKQPVIDEPFEIIFSIKTDSEAQPFISFNPGHAQVLGRESRGVSINTSIINGNFTTERTLRYAYSAVTNRSGTLYLRDIKVDIDGDSVELEPIRVNVLAERPTPRDIFALAEVSTEDAYVGEGVDVRYYLYYRTSIVGREIEQFPRLDNMIKRIHMPGRDSVETVKYQGQIYRRMYIYGARIFPQREGRVFVDPIKIRVQYTRDRAGGSPFGMRTREYATRSVISQQVEIKTKPLPVEGVPASFVGLVGRHELEVSDIHPRHLVNEPIEIQLKISGGGALEEFSAPNLYNEDFLEEFDRQSSLSEVSFSEAQKVFNYIFLGRYPGEVTDEKIKYSYFDPESSRYYEKTIDLPSLLIGGSAGESATVGDKPVERMEAPSQKRDYSLIAPNFTQLSSTMKSITVARLNLLAGMSILFLLFLDSKSLFSFCFRNYKARQILRKAKGRGLEYRDFYQLVFMLAASEKIKYGTIREIISSSSLKDDEKSYFLRIADDMDSREFSMSKDDLKIDVSNKNFQSLIRKIQRVDEENT